MFLPKGTPPALVNKLNAALRGGDGKSRVPRAPATLGLIVVAPERRTPAYLRKFVDSEIEKWAVPIKASGAQNDAADCMHLRGGAQPVIG